MTIDTAAEAKRLIASLDLTNLDDTCTNDDIDALIGRAATPHGPVAAICIWPRFVAYARQRLPDGVRLATVVNFPDGGEDVEGTVAEARQAAADGADEIDLVVAYRRAETDPGFIGDQVRRVRQAVEGKLLKAILETGELDPSAIEIAAIAALENGADFVKTSTGKTATGATPGAARIMLRAIRQSGRAAGLKPSGGIRRFEDARSYRLLADEVMGEGWASPRTFRLGASSVLKDLVTVAGGEPREAAAGEDY